MMQGFPIQRWLIISLFSLLFLTRCTNVAEDYLLESDETLPADEHLVAIEVKLEAGSRVEGDLNITASRVIIDNTIGGDVTVAASQLEIGEKAVIQGDLIYCLVQDGEFEQDDDAVIRGIIRNNCSATAQPLDLTTPWWLKLVGNFALTLAAGLVGALGSIFLPHHLNRMQLTAFRQPLPAIGLGVLSLIILIGLTNLWGLSLRLMLPMIFLPLVLLAWIAAFWLMILGGVALAIPFGAWLLRFLHLQKTPPILTAVVGASTLTFAILSFRLVDLTPLSLVLGAGFLLWGMGAALLARVGRRPHRSR